MPKTDGINALMGIIPIPDHYDINHNATRINTVYTIDHYAYPSGSKPEKSKRVRGPIIPEVGSIYRSNGALPYKPSYSRIEDITPLSDPDNYELKHVIEIKNYEVFFNGSIIARAPLTHNNGKKFTIAQKAQFCKSVVYTIIPQTKYIKVYNKSERKDMDVCVPDDEYLKELIAQYPAIVPQKEAQEIPAIIPEDIVIENITLSPYPGMGILEKAMTNKNWLEIEDREYAIRDIKTDLIEDMYPMGSEYDSICLENEYNRGEEIELYNLLNPVVIVQKYNVPHLRLSIIEERVSA